MKRIFTIMLLSIVGISINSCTKSGGNGNPVTYTIGGLTDVSLSQGESDALTLSVTNTGTYQELVTLSFEGLPAGVSVDLSNNSGTPSFTTRATFSNNSAADGLYHARLVTTGSVTGRRSFDFTVEVTDKNACGLAGNYTYTQTCNGGLSGTETIYTNSENNTVRFSNFGAHGWVAFGNVNCNTGVIEIPLQSVGGNTAVSGTGSFSSTGTITVSYTIYANNVNTNSCTFNLLRSN